MSWISLCIAKKRRRKGNIDMNYSGEYISARVFSGRNKSKLSLWRRDFEHSIAFNHSSMVIICSYFDHR